MAEHIPVKSSNIASAAYDEATKSMEVRFKSGGTYTYAEVPKHVYDGFMSADSHGSFLAAHVKGKYSHAKADK